MGEFLGAIVCATLFNALIIYPLWRIFRRAGLNAALSLMVFIPYVGLLIVILILAFSRWPTTVKYFSQGNTLPKG